MAVLEALERRAAEKGARCLELNPTETQRAAAVGVTRNIRAMAKERTPGHGLADRSDWGLNIEGAIAECLVAKSLDLYWPGSTEPDYGGDIRPGLQVRHTHYRNPGHLRLHERDRDDHQFVLVRGVAPEQEIVGWIKAGDGKLAEFYGDLWNTGRPAFFVPPTKLRSIEELR